MLGDCWAESRGRLRLLRHPPLRLQRLQLSETSATPAARDSSEPFAKKEASARPHYCNSSPLKP